MPNPPHSPVSICKCRYLFEIWCDYWCRGKFKWSPTRFISEDDWNLLAVYIVICVKIYVVMPWSSRQRLDTSSFGGSIRRKKCASWDWKPSTEDKIFFSNSFMSSCSRRETRCDWRCQSANWNPVLKRRCYDSGKRTPAPSVTCLLCLLVSLLLKDLWQHLF